MTVRVGHIEFLNCYPLYYGFEHTGMLADDRHVDRPDRPGVELLPGVPTDLNRMLAAGDIDLGPVSSIAYARNHEALLLSRQLSISSLGAVDSIQLVTARPLEEIRSVALTTQSATSVALLKTHPQAPLPAGRRLLELDGPVEPALGEHDAVLLIGDQGLEALHFPTPGTTCHDLGALWQEWTGLPMVYAVWAAREDFARTQRGRAPGGGGGVGPLHGLRARAPFRSRRVGARPVSLRPRRADALLRPPPLRLHRGVPARAGALLRAGPRSRRASARCRGCASSTRWRAARGAGGRRGPLRACRQRRPGGRARDPHDRRRSPGTAALARPARSGGASPRSARAPRPRRH